MMASVFCVAAVVRAKQSPNVYPPRKLEEIIAAFDKKKRNSSVEMHMLAIQDPAISI